MLQKKILRKSCLRQDGHNVDCPICCWVAQPTKVMLQKRILRKSYLKNLNMRRVSRYDLSDDSSLRAISRVEFCQRRIRILSRQRKQQSLQRFPLPSRCDASPRHPSGTLLCPQGTPYSQDRLACRCPALSVREPLGNKAQRGY